MRVTTLTKTLYQDYLHCVANFCATVLNIFPKEIIANNTECWTSYETLESTDKMKLMMKFNLCLYNFNKL